MNFMLEQEINPKATYTFSLSKGELRMSYENIFEWWSSADFEWFDNSYIKIELTQDYGLCLKVNEQGLRSLSHQIKEILCKAISVVIYDEFPGDLEEGSWAMTLKLISENDFSFPYQYNNILPQINIKQKHFVSLDWRENSCFAIFKEGTHSIQVVGNKNGLMSFSDHLETVLQDNLSIISYKTMCGYRNALPLFSVQMINCQGR